MAISCKFPDAGFVLAENRVRKRKQCQYESSESSEILRERANFDLQSAHLIVSLSIITVPSVMVRLPLIAE
jgi:hypothetical protein